MFRDSIDRLVKVRRYIDKVCATLLDQPWLCARLTDVSYQITMSINDLITAQKILDKENKNEKNQKS